MDFADAEGETRKEYLTEEVRRALAEMVPQERRGFLEELALQFPTWDPNVEVAIRAPGKEQDRGAMDVREIQDPGFLIARLGELASSLDEKERKVLLEGVRMAGLAPQGGQERPEEPAQRLRAAMQLARTAQFDPGRMLDLAAVLGELSASLDQLVWRTWKEMAPKSAIHHRGDLRRVMGRFAAGDADISRTQVSEDIEKLRKLIAAMIAAIKVAGRPDRAGRHPGHPGAPRTGQERPDLDAAEPFLRACGPVCPAGVAEGAGLGRVAFPDDQPAPGRRSGGESEGGRGCHDS